MARTKRDPRSKEDFLDRILRFDFEGDIRQIGAQTASIVRIAPHVLRMTFPESGETFDLTVHKPRSESKAAHAAGETRSFARDRGEPQGRTRIVPDREGAQADAVSTPARRKRRTREQIEADNAAGGRQAARG